MRDVAMTVLWYMIHPGHGGGGWLMLITNNHPAGLSTIAECDKQSCFNFAARGLKPRDYDDEIVKFYNDRMHYGDKAIGIIKSFHWPNVRYATRLVGADNIRVVQLVYNPRRRYCEKATRKGGPASAWYKIRYKKVMSTPEEKREAAAAYFAQNYFAKYVKEGHRWPIIRLEDINLSIKLKTRFFQRFMEWLTGVEWTDEYVAHIRENWTPAYQYYNHLEWEKPPFGGRIKAVVTEQREYMAWRNRDNWDQDPEVIKWWGNLTEEQKGYYHEYTTEVDSDLGYNDGDTCCRLDDWKFRGAYPWGDVYD
jgi:hypothetical protein